MISSAIPPTMDQNGIPPELAISRGANPNSPRQMYPNHPQGPHQGPLHQGPPPQQQDRQFHGAYPPNMPPPSQQQSTAFYPGAATEIPPPPPQQQTQQLPAATPWTLGSTDGSYAINLALLEQQKRHEEQAKAAAAAAAGNAEDNKSPKSSGGAQIHASGEAEEDINVKLLALQNKRSLFQDRLFQQPSASVESTLAAACEVMSFDIAEMWLRTGAKTHQLTNSHLRPTALDESTRMDLVDVYYGDKSSERTHRLSPALCKRAKEANDVVWVTAHTKHGAEALRCSISNVRTAVAVPVCHEASNTNITIIFFSIRRFVAGTTTCLYLDLFFSY